MYFEEFTLGESFSVKPVTISAEKIRSFAEEYDPLPLHLDEEYAKTTIFKHIISPGVMSFMTVWVEFIRMNILGDEMVAGKSTKIEWFGPVYAGDTLKTDAVITNLVKKRSGRGIVETTMNIYNQNDILVMRNITEAVVICKSE